MNYIEFTNTIAGGSAFGMYLDFVTSRGQRLHLEVLQ